MDRHRKGIVAGAGFSTTSRGEILPDRSNPAVRTVVLITPKVCDPSNEDTDHIFKLMGRPLTHFELLSNGTVYLQFGLFGSINLSMKSGTEVIAVTDPKQLAVNLESANEQDGAGSGSAGGKTE